jgi:hypothetical protein
VGGGEENGYEKKRVLKLLLLAMVENEVSPPPFAMVGPTMLINIFKKTRKRAKKGEPKLPTIGKAPLPTYAQKHKKEKKRRRMGACLPWSSRWSFHNFKCLCSSSKLSRVVAFEAHVPSSPSFHLLSIPSSKLSKFTLNHKPKC